MEGAELQWSSTSAQTGEGVKPSDPDLGARGDSHTETGEDGFSQTKKWRLPDRRNEVQRPGHRGNMLIVDSRQLPHCKEKVKSIKSIHGSTSKLRGTLAVSINTINQFYRVYCHRELS